MHWRPTGPFLKRLFAGFVLAALKGSIIRVRCMVKGGTISGKCFSVDQCGGNLGAANCMGVYMSPSCVVRFWCLGGVLLA